MSTRYSHILQGGITEELYVINRRIIFFPIQHKVPVHSSPKLLFLKVCIKYGKICQLKPLQLCTPIPLSLLLNKF